MNNKNTEENITPKPRKVKRKLTFLSKAVISVVMLIAAALIISALLISCAQDVFGINKENKQIEVSIPSGSSAGNIASTLKSKGVIKYQSAFMLYCSLRGDRTNFQAGEYIMNPNMGYDEIIIAMRTGNTIKNVVKITFYEGMSIREIAESLEKSEVCTSGEFIECLNTTTFGFEFEQMIPKSDLRFRKLEGYLFPDTYEFYIGESPTSVAKKFLKNFDNKVFVKLYPEILNSGMTLDEAITLASVIQEEASFEDEMYKVSSIFHNRLDTPSTFPNLQSDVTIFYVEKDIKPYQKRSDQDMYDAYNSYVRVGLPVAPICSPGETAIKAAISPKKTDLYFFVTDAQGKFYYAKDNKTHEANKRTAAAVKKIPK